MLQPLFIYASYLPDAAVSATDTKTGTAAANLLEATEDTEWQPANTSGSKSVTIDLSIAQEIGAIALAGEYLAGVLLEVRASSDNFSSSNVAISAAAAMVEDIANYRTFTPATYRYWRFTVSGHSADFLLYHIALGSGDLLPWPEEGSDLEAYQTTGSNLVSPDGRFLGATRLRTMLDITLKVGQVEDSEYLIFQGWADACVRNLQPFFFVPDSSATACYFAWCDPKQKFSAPYRTGMRNIGSINMTARVP